MLINSLSNLREIVRTIQSELFYKIQKTKEFAHYTSLDTLKNLVSKEPDEEVGKRCFRLYNSAYMNDPEEGHVFFKIMNKMVNEIMKKKNREASQKYDLEKIFYETDGDIPYRSPAYIGSFVPLGAGEKEKLPLWRTYGKQNGEEATGSCLIFPRGDFAESHRLQGGNTSMAITNKNLEKEQDGKQIMRNNVHELFIYKIEYVYKNKKVSKKIEPDLKKLAACLEGIEKINRDTPSDSNTAKDSNQMVRELLDSIRFLFKSSHYKEEREARVLELRYLEENTARESGGIKVDGEQIPPHFYLETPKSFCFREVIFGPRVQYLQEWQQWIKERDPHKHIKIIRKSSIKYGSRDAGHATRH